MVVTSHMPEAALFLVPARQVEASPPAAKDTSNPEDRLATVDALLATYRDQQSAAASLRRELDAERETFVDEAHHALEYIAKPALWAIAQRLLTDGGGGMVVEQAAESKHGQRLTLWMSLEGQVASPPASTAIPICGSTSTCQAGCSRSGKATCGTGAAPAGLHSPLHSRR